MLLRFTLDTTCVIAMTKAESGNPDSEVQAIADLIELARSGTIELQLAAAYDRDFDRYRSPEGRSRQIEWLSRAPIVDQRVPGLFIIGVSILDGPDVIASDDDAARYDCIQSILDPAFDGQRLEGLEPEPLAKRTSDCDHLIAHWRSGADAFVTLDRSTILVHRDALASCGISVLWPAEALNLVIGH